MIERKIYRKLKKYLENKEILALVGSRQVGKTTLMQMLYDEIKYDNKRFISFENQKILNLFESNIDEFIEEYVKDNNYLFIDEIQYAKNSGKNLKYIYDAFDVKIIISGSSATDLSLQSLSYLVGRVFVFEIFPLTFEEFIGYKDKELQNMYKRGIVKETYTFFENYFEEFLQFGGYPKAVISKDHTEKEEILKNLVNSYLLKEIREVLSFENSYEYERLLEMLAIKNSNVLNKSNLSTETQISLSKIKFMLDILDKTYIIYHLRPFNNKKIKEIIKSPKIYFMDIGFRNAILDSFTKTNLRVDKGFIYENFILLEIVKAGFKPKFYNYKNSSEVDFIIEKDDKTIAIEIKSHLSGANVDKSYRTFIDKYSPDEFYILNSNIFDTQKIENTKVIFTHYLNIFSIMKRLEK